MNDNRVFKKPYTRQFVSRKQYDHFKTLGAAPLPAFPTTLIAPYYIDIQDGPRCTAFSGVKERYGATGTRYDPDKQWQLELDFLGVPDAPTGIELDTKMQVGIKIGFVPSGENTPTDAAKSYFWIKQAPGLDWFNSVRLAIFQLYQKYGKVIPVTIGVNWYDDWDHTPNGVLTDNPHNLLGGHDIDIPGLENFNIDNTDYIILAGTWGTQFGDNGIFRVSRTVFNKYFDGYGAAYWSDDPELIPSKLNAIIAALQNVVILIRRVINQITSPLPPFSPQPAPAPTPKPAQPETSEQMVLRVCAEQGLNAQQTNDLYNTLRVESGFNNDRIHRNTDKFGTVLSTDYYLCQVNDFYHIGPGKDFPSVQYVHDHSEEVVRWMCDLCKAGKLSLWVAYSSGIYRTGFIKVV